MEFLFSCQTEIVLISSSDYKYMSQLLLYVWKPSTSVFISDVLPKASPALTETLHTAAS